MAGIDFGLAAADQYYRADDARVLREQQRQQFDWQKQRNEADLSILPERTAAAKSSLQLQDANNKSELDNAPNKAIIAKTLSNTAVELLPQTVAKMKAESALSSVDASYMLAGGLARMLDLNPSQDQLNNFLQQSFAAQGKNDRVARSGWMTNPNDPTDHVFVVENEQGKPLMQMSNKQLSSIRSSLEGAPAMRIIPEGGKGVMMDKRGNVINTIEGNPKQSSRFLSPLERDATALMNTYPGMSMQQAMSQLIFKKGMSLEDHIIQSSAAFKKDNGRPPNQRELEGFKQEYQNAVNTARNTPAGASQPSTSPKSGVDWREWTGTK